MTDEFSEQTNQRYSPRHGDLHWVASVEDGKFIVDLTPGKEYGCYVPLEILDEFLRLREGASSRHEGTAVFYLPPHDTEDCVWTAEVKEHILSVSVEVGPEILTRRASIPLTDARALREQLPA